VGEHRQREQGDLISFLIKIKRTQKTHRQSGEGYKDRWTNTKRYTDRQQGNLISLLSIFKIRRVG
jgi:hypothetical protein